MVETMSSFQAQMNLEKARLSKLMRDTYIGSCITLCDAIISDTPVDTGALKGSWRTSEDGGFITSDNPRIDGTGEIPKSEARNVFRTTQLNTNVYLTNGMHYSEEIEFGGHSSVKAPNGMVNINIQRWPGIVTRFWSGTGRSH